jgi:hypothetical protein
MPMVRRAAASNLGKFAATVEQSHLKTEIMSIFDDLTQDGTSLYIFDVLFYKLVFCRFMQIVSICSKSGIKHACADLP